MFLVRRAFRLERYVLPQHFDNIGKILFTISLFWFYFFAGDAWADWFSRDPTHVHWLFYLFHGYKWVLATIIVFGILVPFPLLALGKVRRTPWLMLLVGISVNVAMFSERVVVVIPAPSRNVLTWGNYTPDWVGVSSHRGGRGPVRVPVHAPDEVHSDGVAVGVQGRGDTGVGRRGADGRFIAAASSRWCARRPSAEGEAQARLNADEPRNVAAVPWGSGWPSARPTGAHPWKQVWKQPLP